MATDVLAAAAGQWPRLLIELAALAPEQLENRHQPCPACGGGRMVLSDTGLVV